MTLSKNIFSPQNINPLLYKALIQQLNKDFLLANINEQILETTLPKELVLEITKIINHLLTHNYDAYLAFIYRVDVSEKKLVTISNAKESVAQQISKLILEREYQKVWFKNKF